MLYFFFIFLFILIIICHFFIILLNSNYNELFYIILSYIYSLRNLFLGTIIKKIQNNKKYKNNSYIIYIYM